MGVWLQWSSSYLANESPCVQTTLLPRERERERERERKRERERERDQPSLCKLLVNFWGIWKKL
jgi:hypothetical protein